MLVSMIMCKLIKAFNLSNTGYFWKQFSCRLEEVFLFPRVLAFFIQFLASQMDHSPEPGNRRVAPA